MAPSTKKTKQAPAPPTVQKEEQEPVDDPLADASLADLEDEITTGPAANWEVAYVFAFLERFTHLVDYDATNPVLPNVMTLEQALIDSSPPASAFAEAAAAAAGGNNPTRTSARLLEESTKQRTRPLTAVAVRNAAAANAISNGGVAPATTATNGDKQSQQQQQQQQRRSGSPASSLSSLTASESGGDTTTTPQDEAAYLAAIQAVETASVPASLAIDPVPPVLPLELECPPHSDLLKTIVETFIENMRPIKELSEYHGKKTWFHFLINFVSYRFSADPLYRGGFRWETNLLRTRGLKPGQEKEDKWWKLRWEDKIHLLRQMVDFQLTNAPAVRDLIKEQYDIGHQRNTRRDPSENYLVLPPAGRTSTYVTLFHLDSSPRLYACGNLYKSDSPWIAVSSTLKGYKAFVKTLAEPTRVERVAAGLPSGAEAEALLEEEREKQRAAARAAAARKNKKGGPLAKASGRGKGKGTVEVEFFEVGQDRMSEERMTRARLEEDLKDMAVYEKHLAALEARRMRASERAARNLSRGFNTPPVAATRSSRLRAREATLRAVNYNETDDNHSGGGDNDDDDDDDDQEEEGGGRRKRRRLDDADADADANGNGNDASLRSSAAPSLLEAGPSATASSSAGRRAGTGAGARQSVVPGERRSSRLQQLPAEPSEPSEREESEPAPDTDAGAAAVRNAPPKREVEAEAEISPEGQGKREEVEPAAAKEEEEEVKPGLPVPVPTTTTTAAAVSGQDGSTIPATPEEPTPLPSVAKAEAGAAAVPPPRSPSPPAGVLAEGGGVATKEQEPEQQSMEDVQPAPTAQAA